MTLAPTPAQTLAQTLAPTPAPTPAPTLVTQEMSPAVTDIIRMAMMTDALLPTAPLRYKISPVEILKLNFVSF